MPGPYGSFQIKHPLPAPVIGTGSQIAQGPPKQPSLWDKLQEIVSPYPQHLKGLIGPDDVKGARNQGLLALGASLLESAGPSTQRTSLGQAIGRGAQAGMGAYQGAVDSMTQRAMARQQMEAGKQGMDMNRLKMEGLKGDMARIQKLDAARQGILQKHGPLPKDPTERQGYLTNVMNDLIAAGDIDSARSISEVLKSGAGSQGSPTYELDRGDVIEIRDKRTNAVIETVKKGMSPRDTAAGADTRAAVQFERDSRREGMLSDDYFQRTRQIAEVAGFASVIDASAESALAGDAAAQQSVLFAIMKMNDPGSSVKEGEYAVAENAAGIPESLRNLYNKTLTGGNIPPESIQRYINQSARMKDSWKRKLQVYNDHFTRRAHSQKLDPQNVLIDYFADTGAPAAPAQAPRFNMDHVFPQRVSK
ncbi:MAG: hypothetical protein K0S14_21 [Thermomicrobiales bacterium]|nr:hypothetical protein [Thermomicrobiales bacterium]